MPAILDTSRRTFLGGTIALLSGSLLRAPAALAQAAAAPVTIEYWIGLGVDSSRVVEALLAKFHAANPGITVKLNNYTSYEPLGTALQAAIAGKRPPAVASVGFDTLRYTSAFLP